MTVDDVKSLSDLAKYIDTYQDTIFVRTEVKGKVGSYSLSELPTKLALKFALGFIQEGRVPYRLRVD